MCKHLVWLALCACFGLSACTLVPTPRQAAKKACADWRRIAIRSPSEAQCPQVPGWDVGQPLFKLDPKLRPVAQGSYDQQRQLAEELGAEQGEQDPGKPDTAEVIQELDRFCVYEPKHKGSDFPSPLPAGLEQVDKDCAAIGSSGGTESPAFKDASDRLLSHAGRPSTPLEINKRLGVRLAFLDTQPTGLGASTAPGNSHHGYTLTHIARSLVCSFETNSSETNSSAPSNRCAAQITTRLALPIVKFNGKHRKLTKTDFVRGGYFGLQSDLAQAITSEVDDWLNERAREQQENPEYLKHLVLNLSVAWDGRLFKDLETKQVDELQAGTQAVYQALRYAESHGVLVVAAAGNRKDHCPQSMTGPLLPAAWDGDGLVYAVGGVRSDGSRLLNARDGGMPPRAAYGENGGAVSWEPERHTAFYTGSSVAAAVASSIAAVVWDTLPTLSPQEVMEILDESGDVLSLNANFGFSSDGSTVGAAAHMVHRLSLCKALRRACDKGGLDNNSCPLGATTCASWTPEEPVLLTKASAIYRDKSCYPWIHPQPDDPPCLNCSEPPPRK